MTGATTKVSILQISSKTGVHTFTVRSSNCVDGRQLANTKSSDESRHSSYPGVTVGGISRIELIAIPDPVKASWFDVVQGRQIVVSWDAMDGLDSHLPNPPKKIFRQIYLGGHASRV
jgi:hypothetical protein